MLSIYLVHRGAVEDSGGQIDLARAAPFRLGPLTVEPALRQVTAVTSETLEPRVMQVLVALVRAEGGIVSRDDLVRQCWEGRIVGDDSVNRVISRLRRLAEERGGGSFRIETITKVGYRLVGSVWPTEATARSALAVAAQAEQSPARGAETLPVERRRWVTLALAGAAILAIAAAVSVLRPSAPKPLQATLRVGEIRSLSPELPATLATALESELQLKIGQSASPLITIVRTAAKDGVQAYVVSGTVRKIDALQRVVIALSREAGGETPLSMSFDRPFGTGAGSLGSLANDAAGMITCTLQGSVEGRTKPLPDSTVVLWSRFCEAEVSFGLPGRSAQITLLRRAVRESSDFAYGWVALADTLAGTMPENEKVVGKPQYDEAIAALSTAERLGFSNYEILNTRARLLSSRDIAGREKLLRASAERFAIQSSGTAPFNLGNLLWNAGRVADAITANRLAVQIDPNAEESAWSLITKLSWTGQRAERDALFNKFDGQWPERGLARQQKFSDALQRGDFPTARATLGSVPRIDPQVKTALDEALAALQHGDARGKSMAADRLVSLSATRETRSGMAVEMLAALGRDEDALKVAESFIDGPRVPSTKVLFQPSLARARALPAFAALVTRLGLVDYWRKSGHPPDFCLAADAPRLCAGLRRTA